MLGFSGREGEFYYELNMFTLSGLHDHVKVEDYGLKGCIFIKVYALRITGRSKCPAIYKNHVPKYHYFILKSIKWGVCFILS
jgi:hypothetical protein